MPPRFVTFAELASMAPSLDESTGLRKAAASRANKTIFLSHSSKDDSLVPSIIAVLENHGGRVYADNGDTRLPDIPSPETAQILRDTLTACRKLVVLVTTNSKDSKWIPWELGLGDGYHAPDAVALLPAIPEGGPQLWAEREYLGLYDRIVWGKIKGDLKEHWIVWNHQSNTAIALEQWITR